MGIFSRVKKIINDLLFPYVCHGCGVEGAILCSTCRTQLSWIHPVCFVCKKFSPGNERIPLGRTCESCQKMSYIYGFLSPFVYKDKVIRECIHSFKYQRVRPIADVFAGLIAEYLSYYRISLPSDAVVIPIPLYSSRRRVRGFNQSELIARYFVEKFGEQHLYFEKNALIRVKKTTPQIDLSHEERRRNVEGVFRVVDFARIRNATVILVDDVATTGATLEEAARVLSEAGAKRVWAITVAH